MTFAYSLLQALEGFYENFDSDFIGIRTKAREVLQREDDLNEIVQVRQMQFVPHCSFLFYMFLVRNAHIFICFLFIYICFSFCEFRRIYLN